MSSNPVDLPIPPGIVKSQSENSVGSRYTDCDKIRFHTGKAEKIGGWSKLISDQFESYAREAQLYRDIYGNQNICFGTSDRLYMIEAGQALRNVTPLADSGTLTDPFSTTSGSDIVDVADTAHGLSQIGDVVVFSGATAVGGITVDGEYTVYNIVDNDNYQIQHSSSATSNDGPGGGSVGYEYEIPKGNVDAAQADGYGVGGYGEGTYGTPRETDFVQIEPRLWSIQKYGTQIRACYNGSTLYALDYDATLSPRATAVSNAPAMRAMVITPERYIFALGCVPAGDTEINPMHVRWPDVDDETDWTPSATNTSNARTLQSGNELIAGAELSALVTLVWSDTSLYKFQFTGSSFIYDSRLAGKECGLAGPAAHYVVDDIAYWMSPNGFFLYNGSVRKIPNSEDIREYVIDSFNTLQIKKACTAYFSAFREIWWIYPSGSATEPDAYVSVNIDTFAWAIGTIDRSAFSKYRSEDSAPLLFGTDRYVYLHEDGTQNADGAAMEAYIQTGLMKIANGKNAMHVQGFIPDMDRQTGDLSLYVYARDHPKGGVIDSQTKTIADTDQVTDLRVSGRHVAYKITSNVVDGDFRMGTNAVEVEIGGEARGR